MLEHTKILGCYIKLYYILSNYFITMTSNSRMNVAAYIDQFNILESKDKISSQERNINCDVVSQMLYATILNKFKISMTEDEYVIFKEYQERMFDLVENMRELSASTIPIIFEYLDKVNHCLPDIIIMLWCLPRSDKYLSKQIYKNCYKQNIQKYNEKLVKNITHEIMKNFCIETLTKTNNVPIHCIDYIWFYMNTIEMEFTFYNLESCAYIGFIMPDYEHHPDDNYIDFGFNMEYLLEMGLGQIAYTDDLASKGSFRNFLKQLVINVETVKKLLTIKTKQNYRKQLTNISKNPSKYFGDSLSSLPQEVMDELNKPI